MFQSSPGLAAGCFKRRTWPPWSTLSFQSSPGLAAGCFVLQPSCLQHPPNVSILTRPCGRVLQQSRAPALRGGNVSILTRPCGRVLRGYFVQYQRQPGVSILTRPCGRVLRARSMTSGLRSGQFQSSPGLAAGCFSTRGEAELLRQRGFNPHPALRPGASVLHAAVWAVAEKVSILTRPCGRVLRSWGSAPTGERMFQSSPGLAAGCF